MSLCPTCNDDFSEEFKMPKVLPCGHTYCLICLIGFFQNRKVFVCPECSYTINDISIIKKLPNNNALIKCIRQLKMQNNKIYMSPSTTFSQSNSNAFTDTQDSFAFSVSAEHFRSFSPSRLGHSPDSFNFDGFKTFFEDHGPNKDKNLMKSMTMPKGRCQTSPRKVNDIEINEKGIFREKNPSKTITETCCIKMCDFPRMYMKGNELPFCSFHYAQLNPSSPFSDGSHTPAKNLQVASQTNQFPFFEGNQHLMDTPNHQNLQSNSQSHSDSFRKTNSRDSTSFVHKFGRPSKFELSKQFEKTPQPFKEVKSFEGVQMTNSFFTGPQSFENQNPTLSQSVDFGKVSNRFSESSLPFPKILDPSVEKNKSELMNKCMIPDCTNQRLVHKGMTYPVCGRKCWLLWQNQPKEAPFWT